MSLGRRWLEGGARTVICTCPIGANEEETCAMCIRARAPDEVDEHRRDEGDEANADARRERVLDARGWWQ